jgi:putative nucleotidyltransferase with HDIG domain
MNRNGKILIVDDEKSIRLLLKEVLEKEGYTVRTTADAFDALDLVRSTDIDLVLTDIKMPGMSGIELIEEASKIKDDVIFMIMTGYASIDSARKAMKYGVYDYISKPFDLSYMKLAVSRAFERKSLFDENVRLKELAKLFVLTESINSTLERTRLSKLLLKSALAYTGSDSGAMVVYQDEAFAVDGDVIGAKEISGEFLKAIPTQIERFSEMSRALLKKRSNPVLITGENCSSNVPERIYHVIDREHEWMKDNASQILIIPVSRFDKLHGFLSLMKRNNEKYTQRDVDFVSIIASQGAVTFENTNLISDLENAYISMIESLVLIVEAKDTYTYGHSKRVSSLSVKIGKRLGMNRKDQEILKLAASLHDIGKISVPETILNKPEKLDSNEWAYIQRHTAIADEILQPLRFLSESRRVIRYHHENYDGSGYPTGVKGDEIPYMTRIMTVADAFDAMSSVRAYRKPLSKPEIKRELEKGAGKQFDPEVVKIMIEIMEEEAEALT